MNEEVSVSLEEKLDAIVQKMDSMDKRINALTDRVESVYNRLDTFSIRLSNQTGFMDLRFNELKNLMGPSNEPVPKYSVAAYEREVVTRKDFDALRKEIHDAFGAVAKKFE